MVTRDVTYVMIKPDISTDFYKVNEVFNRFEKEGLTISEITGMIMSNELIEEHYKHLVNKPFFHEICDFMSSGYVLPMVVTGECAVEKVKEIVGPTRGAQPGTLRADLTDANTNVMRNGIHCTDPNDPEGTNLNEVIRFFGEEIASKYFNLEQSVE